MEKCLYCYKPLKIGQVDYHPACAKKLFGTKEAPVLPYVRKEIGDLAKQVVRAQTTLTGVQAKLSLDVNPGGKNEPSRFTIVGLWGKYILKPQTDRYRCLPEIEDLTMHLAEAAKIAVVPHGLIRFADGELCYITRRIDRQDDGTKIPMEDMCQLSERLTEYKYKGSYEQVAKLIKKYSSFSQLALQQQETGLWINPSLRPSLHQDCNAGRYRRTRPDAQWQKAKDSESRFHQGNDRIRTQRKGNQQHRQEVPPLHREMARPHRSLFPAG